MVYAFMVVNMDCRECIYGKDDFERRMACYDSYVTKYGIPNDVYGNMTREDAEKEALNFMWCEKQEVKYIFLENAPWQTRILRLTIRKEKILCLILLQQIIRKKP